MQIIKKIFRLIFKIIKWVFILIVGLAIVSALYNLTLPQKTEIVEYLPVKEKAFIAEAMNLQNKMGNEVWPGWGDTCIPVMVYNEKYAFLVGYPDPPAGWTKMPQREFRGTEWEVVEGDDFFGTSYYRQSLPDPKITPENFTVLVGDRWVATMQTKEYAAVAFYKGFSSELPPVLNAIFPYKIFWNIIMGEAEKYIGGLLHEAFHSFQGAMAPQRLAEAEYVAWLENDYPWHDKNNADGWKDEINLLLKSFDDDSPEFALQLVAQFLDKRNERRIDSNLSVEMIQYEQKREWLEGLAKYTELTIGLKASQNEHYENVKDIESLSEFKNYKTFVSYYDQQIEEVKRSAVRAGENRFYYTGMLQAVMLDRLMPEWKKEAFHDEVYLEDLLAKAVNDQYNSQL